VDYINIGVSEGAKVLTGGSANNVETGGFYIKPTILGGTNDMRVFQEEVRDCFFASYLVLAK
jgi:aldehyde dehydrogenase